MSRTTLLHLTLTADPTEGAQAYSLTAAMDRMRSQLSLKLGEALREAKGPVTLTLELYKESNG